ncbi:hypothetical protein AVEN_155084-1 [Araneus ventricosus]|uniref:Uncharacterized protein n=1 Tax=Araneus ventricosus TaxID=182803 RepID=A0A4Y2A7J5_ARAVE|nr:hypothetical protein AVEN_155084-1 [Araneus ventricosus]
MGPRWPSGKASASGLAGSRFHCSKPDSTEDPLNQKGPNERKALNSPEWKKREKERISISERRLLTNKHVKERESEKERKLFPIDKPPDTISLHKGSTGEKLRKETPFPRKKVSFHVVLLVGQGRLRSKTVLIGTVFLMPQPTKTP